MREALTALVALGRFARVKRGVRRCVPGFDRPSIAIAPKIAWSWYGRGIDKLRQHQTAAGEANIAQAKSLAAKIAEAFAKHGIEP